MCSWGDLYGVEVETVDVYDIQLCSMARGIDANSLVTFVSLYRQSEESLLERLRLNQEAFLTANNINIIIQNQKKQQGAAGHVVQPPKEPPSMEEIRSVKLHESARKLHQLMLLVPTRGVHRCALAFKVEQSKIIEIVSRYRAAMGRRLERLKHKEQAFLEKRESVQEYDFKQIGEEWDQIYALLDELEESRLRKD